MSKKACKGSGKQSSKNTKPGGESNNKPTTTGPVYVDPKTGNVIVKILAKPGAKTNGITDVSEEGVGCQIAAPPLDGEANTELIKYLSKLLDLRKSDISLDRGSKSRQKTIVLDKSGCAHSVEHLLSIFHREASTEN
ncbi:AGAP001528-PA-like protein [Anopheles sinensis]|uniref:AGAP001528-PA-like protein n=1 Tax=Anopheles sinensis TaxID=74873 RepID=A0A084W506_ANOSI|nr:AGAP001528-PA-like protein [Anopheles sinensis]